MVWSSVSYFLQFVSLIASVYARLKSVQKHLRAQLSVNLSSKIFRCFSVFSVAGPNQAFSFCCYFFFFFWMWLWILYLFLLNVYVKQRLWCILFVQNCSFLWLVLVSKSRHLTLRYYCPTWWVCGDQENLSDGWLLDSLKGARWRFSAQCSCSAVVAHWYLNYCCWTSLFPSLLFVCVMLLLTEELASYSIYV